MDAALATAPPRKSGMAAGGWKVALPVDPYRAAIGGNEEDTKLVSVACPSPRECFGVGGYSQTHSRGGSLIERWNGISWRIADRDPRSSGLTSVACSSPSSCVAVGDVVRRWNGHGWSGLALPRREFLDAVSCVRGYGCLANGLKYPNRNPAANAKPLTVHIS
jgi:hypothetical protein